MTDLSRRSFLRRAAIAAPSLAGLVACSERTMFDPLGNGEPSFALGAGGRAGYGKLKVYKDYPQISLPAGFHAELLSTSGDVMSDGNITANAMDGMGAFAVDDTRVRLVRNHEIRNGRNDPNRQTLGGTNPYDEFAPSGNSTLEVEVRPDGSAELKSHFVSLDGTFVNCAGGQTPWGSWITCEETVAGIGDGWARNHGYNFEIPASANGPVNPVPLREMGRFVHEAVSVDPYTGIVYQTEDRNPSGFYRFIPSVPNQLHLGGTLEMLAIRGQPQYDTRRGQIVGTGLECEWVPIENPDSDEPSISTGFVFNQGFGSVRPCGLKQAPAHSAVFTLLRTRSKTWTCRDGPGLDRTRLPGAPDRERLGECYVRGITRDGQVRTCSTRRTTSASARAAASFPCSAPAVPAGRFHASGSATATDTR